MNNIKTLNVKTLLSLQGWQDDDDYYYYYCACSINTAISFSNKYESSIDQELSMLLH